MTTGTGADQNKAINALLSSFFGMFDVNHVVEHNTAIAVRGFNNEFRRAQRGNDNRHFMLHAKLHIRFQTVIRCVANLVDRKRGNIFVRIGGFIRV